MMKRGPYKRPLIDRLMERIAVDGMTGCWNWTGSKRGNYGSMRVGGAMQQVHRLSYEVHRGPIPGGICVCHRCDNPVCINPDHLFLGTHCDNMADKVSKSRQSSTLSVADVLEIRAASGVVLRALSERYGVSVPQISYIRSGKKWRHLNRE